MIWINDNTCCFSICMHNRFPLQADGAHSDSATECKQYFYPNLAQHTPFAMLRHLYKCSAPVLRRQRPWHSISPATRHLSTRTHDSNNAGSLPTGRGETGGFELTFLGTSSQGGACRYPSSLALRLRGSSSSEVWIFDAGEGSIAQLQRSYMRVGAVRNIFVTHVHGDHLYGLPGLVLSVLARRHSDAGSDHASAPPLRVFGPPGVRNFLRMALGVASSTLPLRDALQINEVLFPTNFAPTSHRFRFRRSQAYWRASVRPLPFETAPRDIAPDLDPAQPGRFTFRLLGHGDGDGAGRFEGDGAPASVIAAPVLHTVPCLAYTVREHVIARRFDKAKLSALGVPATSDERSRELFQTWLRGDPALVGDRLITPEEVLTPGRRGRSMCIVGDTQDASGAAHIAQDVDVLIHEATNLAAQAHIARRRGHSSTRGATSFAKRVAARRLVLNHTSVAYSEPKLRVLEAEARALFGVDRVYVARDLSVFNVPTEYEDSDSFIFRRFVGFVSAADCARQRGLVPNAHGELVRDSPFRPLMSEILAGDNDEDVFDSAVDTTVEDEMVDDLRADDRFGEDREILFAENTKPTPLKSRAER